MDTTYSHPTLVFKPAISTILILLLVFIHGGAMILVMISDLPSGLGPALLCLITINLFRVIRNLCGMPFPNAIQRFTCTVENRWLLALGNGSEIEARLLPSSFVHPWLVVLNFQLENHRRMRSVVLFTDALERDALRQLRVWLRTVDHVDTE